MQVNDSQYLNFIQQGLALARQLPPHFSRYANKVYTTHQHLLVLVLKQKLKTTYRGIIELLNICPAVCKRISLTQVPHHTTLIKFAKKLNGKLLSLLFTQRKAHTVAVDATGFEMEMRSFYFRTVWNSERMWKTHEFTKLSIAIDTTQQTILRYVIRRKRRHDTLDFQRLVRDLDVAYVVADKGYDSKKNRNFVLHTLHAMPIIPMRWHRNFYGYNKGKRKINGENYHQRSKVETVFSVIKRKYGSVLRARSFAAQQVEVICKLIAYNVDRMTTLSMLLIRGFQQSL